LTFDETSGITSFTGKTPYGLTEHFNTLPAVGIHFVPEILPRLHFGLFTDVMWIA